MPQRGRPKNNGARDAEYLFRVAIALCAFDQARLAGEKYSAALQAAVAAVHQNFPDSSMSETEMKRILAELRSSSMDSTLFFDETDNTVPVNEITHVRAWTIRIGPMPNYPRHNARATYNEPRTK